MTMMRANDTFWVSDTRIVRAGDLLPGDDPCIEGREKLFSPIAPSSTAADNAELLERIARLEQLLMASGAAAPAKATSKKST